MAKGDSGSGMNNYQSPMPMMNYGMPQQGNSIGRYGMNSLGPTMAMMQGFPQFGQLAGANPGMFRMMMNPGFNFNTPISQQQPQGSQMAMQRRSPFAAFAGGAERNREMM